MARYSISEPSKAGAIEGPVEVIDAGYMMIKPKPGDDWSAFPTFVLKVESTSGEKKPHYNVPFSKERWGGKVIWSMDGETPLDLDDDSVELAPHLYVEADEDFAVRPSAESELWMLVESLANAGFDIKRFDDPAEGTYALRGLKGSMIAHEDDKGTEKNKKRRFSIFETIDPASMESTPGKKATAGAKAKTNASASKAKAAPAPSADAELDDDNVAIVTELILEYLGEQSEPVEIKKVATNVFVKASKSIEDVEARKAVRGWVTANLETIEGVTVEGGKASLG